MHRSVAIDLSGGPGFIDAVRKAWDQGDAVVPLDQRLPAAARQGLLDRAPETRAGDALVVFTSGSTGAPKPIIHTHDSLRAHAEAVHERLKVDPARDRWLSCLPLNHLGGFGVIARALITGTPVDALPRFDSEVVSAAPAEVGTTLVSLVARALDRVDPAPFRCVVLGGSSDSTQRPANVVHTYGLTETGGGVVYDGVPLRGVEVEIDAGSRISIRSATLARGVAGDDGWLRTGDLGRWDDDGLLVIDGRADDLIITGGENVWPTVVENALASHPGIEAAAVWGEPDPQWGQRIVASVIPTDPSTPPTLAGVRAHVKQSLPAYAAPHDLRLVQDLPRTALGKLVRPKPDRGQ